MQYPKHKYYDICSYIILVFGYTAIDRIHQFTQGSSDGSKTKAETCNSTAPGRAFGNTTLEHLRPLKARIKGHLSQIDLEMR